VFVGELGRAALIDAIRADRVEQAGAIVAESMDRVRFTLSRCLCRKGGLRIAARTQGFGSA
jgi:hypothetical protein